MNQAHDFEIEAARRWLTKTCHHAGVRQVLERGLEYVEAVDRAGIPPEITPGEELYEFLTDPDATEARSKSFVPPTM